MLIDIFPTFLILISEAFFFSTRSANHAPILRPTSGGANTDSSSS
jgi:hypothetical protein